MRMRVPLVALCGLLLVTSLSVSAQKDTATAIKEKCADLKACIKSAEAGNAEAQYLVGKWCQFRDTSKDHFKKAAKWYTLAAKQGQREAQFRLADLYLTGRGVHMLYSAYHKWMKKSAENGYEWAQYRLAEDYASCSWGNFEVKYSDYPKAFKWYLAAAKQGNVFAQVKVGYYYMKGIGTKKDLVKAYFWLGIARDRDVGPAYEVLRRYRKRFNARVVALAEPLIEEWHKAHPNEEPVGIPRSDSITLP